MTAADSIQTATSPVPLHVTVPVPVPVPAPFTVLIPARMGSSRLPGKPLADICGKPMVVRVAERAAQSGAASVVVATDAAEIEAACAAHGVRAVRTRADHVSGSDRLAEACALLSLASHEIVVNVQGDEPMIEPALVRAVADLMVDRPAARMGTAAHAIETIEDFLDPNVVKVVLDAAGMAVTFSRAPIPYWRDAPPGGHGRAVLPMAPRALRHVGLYSYRAGFLRDFAAMPPAPLEQCEALEQLRALWHGHRIAVHVACTAPRAGVDTAADLQRVRALVAAGA